MGVIYILFAMKNIYIVWGLVFEGLGFFAIVCRVFWGFLRLFVVVARGAELFSFHHRFGRPMLVCREHIRTD